MKCSTSVLRAGAARFAGSSLGVCLVLQLSACGIPLTIQGGGAAGPETTYEKLLPLAEAGDAESQNAVGFMLFHGEGVDVDRVYAEIWFSRAAEQGNAKAERNLAFIQSMGSAVYDTAPREPAAAMQGRLSGEELYARFCAGCHGFNGIARYVYSPSFALGQALEKSDSELMRSLLRGKGEMPNWDDKLSRDELEEVLRFVRTLPSRYELGIRQALRAAPARYFLFGPMKSEAWDLRGSMR